MKVTTEKLPQSLLALQIELDKERFERGLDQAARRLSQKYPVHGFRPGKAPRFIIERTFGRESLIEEASEDLINKAFRDALKQEKIEPVGPASLQGISSAEPFTFTIHVPVPPTVDVGDYRAIHAPLEIEPITEEQLDRAMDVIRERHVVLKELAEPRPVQEGDQIRVRLDTIVEGEPLEERDENEEPAEQTLDVVPGRLVDELYAGLLGMQVGERREMVAQMSEDHANEQVRGKEVTFKVELLGIQERLLPDWEDVPTLENFEGSLEDLRAKTRAELEQTARNAAERQTLDSYIDQLVTQTSFDIPEVMVRELAESLLQEQERQFARYGITLEQMLEFRGQSRDDAIEALMPDAERQTKINLALREIVRREGLETTEAELVSEMDRLLIDYEAEDRANVAQILRTQLRSTVANAVLDRKLRERLLVIATGTALEPESPAATGGEPAPAATEAEPVPVTTTAATAETPRSTAEA
ncbi:MAG: trigger factor [Chloroflexi bacterium]|nr:trigger factor [Chloroflexota bacterium]